jgi:hypothetical protein
VPRPRKARDHQAAYRRRDARARAEGFASYYDKRVRSGKLSAPRPRGRELRRRRGHAGRADFLASLGEGDLIIMPRGISSVEYDPNARNGQGAYREIEKLVVYARPGVLERTWILRNLTRAELIETIKEEQRRGAYFAPSPSLDQRRLPSREEVEGGY